MHTYTHAPHFISVWTLNGNEISFATFAVADAGLCVFVCVCLKMNIVKVKLLCLRWRWHRLHIKISQFVACDCYSRCALIDFDFRMGDKRKRGIEREREKTIKTQSDHSQKCSQTKQMQTDKKSTQIDWRIFHLCALE